MREEELYELTDKQENRMIFVVSALALAAVLYLAIEVYTKQIVPAEEPMPSYGVSSKYSAIADGFNKK
jgi:predicted membrane protein